MARQRAIIIVPAAQQVDANKAAKLVDKVGGEFAFTVPLVGRLDAEGAPPRGYICNWQFEADERAEFEAACKRLGIWTSIKVDDLTDPDPADTRNITKEAILTREGLKDRQAANIRAIQ